MGVGVGVGVGVADGVGEDTIGVESTGVGVSAAPAGELSFESDNRMARRARAMSRTRSAAPARGRRGGPGRGRGGIEGGRDQFQPDPLEPRRPTTFKIGLQGERRGRQCRNYGRVVELLSSNDCREQMPGTECDRLV